jgi:hypothetical protein
VHRPRGGSALTDGPPPSERPLPQAWVPRVLNGAIAAVLVLLISPIVATWGDRSTLQRVFLTGMALFVLFFAGICLASALRPGSLGRAARRAKARRTR